MPYLTIAYIYILCYGLNLFLRRGHSDGVRIFNNNITYYMSKAIGTAQYNKFANLTILEKIACFLFFPLLSSRLSLSVSLSLIVYTRTLHTIHYLLLSFVSIIVFNTTPLQFYFPLKLKYCYYI